METRLPITQTTTIDTAFRGYAKSFTIRVLNSRDPLEQLRLTRVGLKVRIEKEQEALRGIKFKVVLLT